MSVSAAVMPSISPPSSSSSLPHVLLAVTGSVASVKVEALVALLLRFADVRVVASAAALRFFSLERLRQSVCVYTDEDEWRQSSGGQWSRGDGVLHIQLRKWCDMLLIAPLSANSLAEIAHGLCPNIAVRAEDSRAAATAATASAAPHPLTCPA